jgi:transcriptional antiterminator
MLVEFFWKGGGATAKELAKRFDVSTRTIQNDLKRLHLLEKEGWRYYLPDRYRQLRPYEKAEMSAAMMMARQLEIGLFDFRLHVEFDPDDQNQVQRVLNQVRQEVAVILPPGEWRELLGGKNRSGEMTLAGYEVMWLQAETVS